ncbi:MAG: VOC family protein [Ectothiorhodospiraceae bacterium]|nr:VOC family protein [Ectothiorhodospiraceae bacterium]MCH8504773.1 VOC family protein [Ectothiorhodospiraceae bacterium]
MNPRFHLAFPVTDLEAARRFYLDVLGCRQGRDSERWVDFDFQGHQITAHLVDDRPGEPTNPVDGKQVPVRHFGLILEWGAWERMVERLRAAGVDFLIEPGVRFKGKTGEQATCFFTDPSGNALEFKAFRDDAHVFDTGNARYD